MTRASTDAGRADKMSSATAKGGKDDAATDADFEAAYAADGEAEATPTAKDAQRATAGEDTSGETRKVRGDTSEGAVDTVGAEAEATDDNPPLVAKAPEKTVPSTEGAKVPLEGDAAVDDPATVRTARRSDTSELAFAQRLRSGESQVANSDDGMPGRSAARDAQGDTLARTGSTPVDSTKAAPSQILDDMVHSAGKAQSGADASRAAAELSQLQLAHTAEKPLATTPKTPVMPPPDAVEELPRGLRRKLDDIRAAPQTDAASATQPKQTANAPAPTLPPQGVAQLTAQPESASLDLQLVPVGDLDAPSSWDPRAAAPATLAQTLSRPEVPGMIGRQLAEVLQQNPGRPVEVSLNPEELGRVRLNISAGEAGITVHVLAERPETLDLMRRHIDQLAREFQALGYDTINFAFNEEQAEQNAGSQDGHDGQTAVTAAQGVDGDADQGDPDMPISLVATTGVDLRV
ncbi:flagellar hook-length control protein FliK [Roseobacter cerasinus]|nr:flagellar hook-length control protein FliK [Roseobacter cerasinus]